MALSSNSQALESPFPSNSGRRNASRIALAVAALTVLAVLAWQALAVAGVPDPNAAQPKSFSGILDIGILVFREGLECILVLAAVTASMVAPSQAYGKPVALGAGVAFLVSLITWRIAVGIVDDLSSSVSALALQAGTGLLAIIVLLVVMNWFFHKVYWTGWISMHNKRKRQLLESAGDGNPSRARLLWGMGLLGFTSLYREGFEVVLFLQSYRLRFGGRSVFYGVVVGVALTGVVAVLTFVAHRKLPYKKMLVLTGVMLGGVLLVMVGEQAQEMQLAHWLPIHMIPSLVSVIPAWAGLWFSVFPTVETLAAQGLAGMLVIGSYFAARK